jgi:RNA polymerase sigma-70 factor, ECF subfamily
MALVERCRSGDLGAFEELYRAHAGKLFSVACRMLGNPADAEDLLQEIFLSAHRKLESFRGESALGTWLYRLATNQCLDYLRSRAARTSQVTDALEDDAGFDAGGGTLAEQTVTKMDLERALVRLPEGCRAAFVLHDIQGLEHREVAEALGIAEGTSKSQVHKARRRLRALLR